MGLFFDPLQKKPKPWVFLVFVMLPIIGFIIFLIVGSQYAKKTSINEKEITPEEFFRKFDPTSK